MSNEMYSEYIDDLLNCVMVKKMRNEELDIDPESYEEMRSIADDTESLLIDPES